MSLAITLVEAPEEVGLLDAVRALALRAKASWGYDADFMDRFAASMLPERLVGPGRRTWVARLDGRLAAFAICDLDGEVAWLEDLWVDPSLQRRGVGRALFAQVLAAATEAGARTLDLESDPNAEPFYLAQGCRRTATRPSTLAPGRDLPLLRHDLFSPTR